MHVRQFDRPDESEMFLKPPRKTNHLQCYTTETLALCKLLIQLQKRPENGEEGDLREHLMLVDPNQTRSLQAREPAVQLLSFLVRLKRGHLAARVFSTYLHCGMRFSLDALRHLCLVAACIKPPTPLDNFVKEAVHTAPHSKRGVKIINDLIVQLHFHQQWGAVLRLGSMAFEGFAMGTVQYRKTLQSLFHIHQVGRKASPSESAVRLEGLLETLSLWINAREATEAPLDQYDISVLIQGLSSLLYKVHKREVPLPPQYRPLILGMINLLSRGMEHPLSRMAMAETVLENQDAARLRISGHDNPPTPLDSFKPLLLWASRRRSELLEDNDGPALMKATKMATRSRISKILARNSINTRDDYEFIDHLQETVDIQNHLSATLVGLNGVSANHVLALRLLVMQSQMRFTSTLIRLCSRFLRSQSLPEIFLLLPYTRHLHDLQTFSRLWKRALYVVVRKGCWDGELGLKRLLLILVGCRPPRWDEVTVGEHIFASSSLVADSLRVAIADIQSASQSSYPIEEASKRILDRPSQFREWCQLIDPFIRSSSLPWYEELKTMDRSQQEAGASSKLLGKMRNVA